MITKALTHQRSSSEREQGFTLVELLTALAVISIAATVFFKLFISSNALADTSTEHEVAADLAQEYLTTIQYSPQLFEWPNYADNSVGELQPVSPIEGGPTIDQFAQAPNAPLSIRRAHNRETNLYTDFSWQAFARLPHESAQYVEVLVEISWRDNQKIRQFALTSTMPRNDAEGLGS